MSVATPPPSLLKVGFYEVEATIGRGNYATVKLARHKIIKNEVAIKVVDKSRLDKENLDKVYREIEVLKTLNHPYIIKLYQVMETKNMIYLITEYAPNGEIYDQIARQHRLTEEDARWKFWQIVSAVEYCHQRGIVHRDLKAENLLLDNNFRIKIADFGFSNFYSKELLLQTFCGSPPYAAPEVFEGNAYYGPNVDVWSLGVILYVMVCGSLPFEGTTIQALRDRVLQGRYRVPYYMSSDCEVLIRRMLKVTAKKRITIANIKKHPWMQMGNCESRIHQELRAHEILSQGDSVQASLKWIKELGVEEQKLHESLKTAAYDNIMGMFHLLMERWKHKNIKTALIRASKELEIEKLEHTIHNISSPAKEVEGSEPEDDADSEINQKQEKQIDPLFIDRTLHPPPSVGPVFARPRPLLRSLRDHQQFQTTDIINSYEERASTLSRQSTVGTIGSLDEGVESDLSGSSTSGAFSMWQSNDPTGPFESFESQLETDLMSSQSSCLPHSEGSGNSHANPTHLNNSVNILNPSEPSTSGAECCFGDGLRASDNTMFKTLQALFPIGKLNKKTRATEINRPSTEGVNKKLENMKIVARYPLEKRNRLAFSALPKRISLPDHLEFQPQKLLSIKKSIQVEQKMEGKEQFFEGKFYKARMLHQHKRQINKNRLQILRQQKACLITTSVLSPLRDEHITSQLSPIEDNQKEEGMDLA